MLKTELTEFVRESLKAGASREETRQALLDAGWPRTQIDAVLNLYAESSFRIPVPNPKPQRTSRDTFVYLVLFGTLYLSVYNLGSLIFDYLNILFPADNDAVATLAGPGPGYPGTESSIRFSIASLVIAFPVFLYVSRYIMRLVEADPVHRLSTARKWLTYLTLAIAAFTLIGDLISVLYGFLSGEITVRFLLKTFTIFCLAGSVYWYYSTLMKMDDKVSS
ncbi:MAG: DUF5671 domain-containing protein [Gammaproteobacteria bacterium]|nr:DUF5671 domain-containing protein [Gammaproteobacteria bacterium]MCY4356050.1 DUF5671 domain-containing protein [Gammaproteobacteria bacterium]